MTQYLVAGLVLGGIYALIAAGLIVTYTSSGILNFAFGSTAYFIAKLFYFLHSRHHWNTAAAALFCLVVAAPALGALLWAMLFRTLQQASSLTKIVATIGLSVALPALALIAFGNDPTSVVPGLAPIPVPVYHVFGTALTLDQVIVLSCVAVVGGAGWWIMRFTDVGLVLRAMVSSRSLTQITGTDLRPYSLGLWAAMTLLAGLAGILVAPTSGLTSSAFTVLMASAFAAVLAGKFRHVGRGIAAGLLLGIAGALVQRYVPADSIWSTTATSSIPFALIVGFLLYYIPRGDAAESGAIGSALDVALAVRSSGGPIRARRLATHSRRMSTATALFPLTIGCVALFLVPVITSSYWVGTVGSGVTFAVAFLSYTLITGEAGVISLCQITFAGVGAIATAELATKAHFPVPLAVFLAGCIVVPGAALLGYLTTRLGDLYVALVTLTFGLLMDNLVFTLNVFSNYDAGVPVTRPHVIAGANGFLYMAVAVFIVLAALIALIRRSTYGMAVVAVRCSERGARNVGLSSAATKVSAMCVGGFIAGVGGGLMALYAGAAEPENFSTLFGFVWLAIVVTVGIRQIVGALFAGVSFTLLPALFTTYLTPTWAQVPTVLFGAGAVFVAHNPDGAVATHARQLRALGSLIRPRRGYFDTSVPETFTDSTIEESLIGGQVPAAAGRVEKE